VYDVVGIFRAALNRVISDDSSNSSIVLGLHSGTPRNVVVKTFFRSRDQNRDLGLQVSRVETETETWTK